MLMRKIRVTSAGGSFELIEEPVREPVAGYVSVKVQACGICHSDSLTKLSMHCATAVLGLATSSQYKVSAGSAN
jgi:D-arabinose 1-dehydrogenase-like Zn-dependent alcohol dehydrogenase